ncbi:MAG: cell division protein ZapA [Acidobacteria bacterium]|nr:MAG: cell division protein ZapA [Acidobacteriota bacterium]
MSDVPRVVSVEILGQQYPIRSPLDARYVADLAAYVDEKIRSTADITPTTDTVRLAVLAALNIADDYFHARDGDRERRDAVMDRVARLERLIDDALVGSGLLPAGDSDKGNR